MKNMKFNKSAAVAAMATLVAGFSMTSASAANVSTSPSDLILGFEVTDNAGTGASTNLEIDLGDISKYTTGQSYASITGVVDADLVATYGADWATRTDLAWAVAGVSAPTKGLTDVFDLTDSSGTAPGDPVNNLNPYGTILELQYGLGANTALSDSSGKAGQVPVAQVNSFSAEQNPNSGADFGFTPGYESLVNDGLTVPVGSDELYTFMDGTSAAPLNGIDEGTFTLSSSGNFSFQGLPGVVAVPEPSTYALMAGGFVGLILFLRRRRVS